MGKELQGQPGRKRVGLRGYGRGGLRGGRYWKRMEEFFLKLKRSLMTKDFLLILIIYIYIYLLFLLGDFVCLNMFYVDKSINGCGLIGYATKCIDID